MAPINYSDVTQAISLVSSNLVHDFMDGNIPVNTEAFPFFNLK